MIRWGSAPEIHRRWGSPMAAGLMVVIKVAICDSASRRGFLETPSGERILQYHCWTTLSIVPGVPALALDFLKDSRAASSFVSWSQIRDKDFHCLRGAYVFASFSSQRRTSFVPKRCRRSNPIDLTSGAARSGVACVVWQRRRWNIDTDMIRVWALPSSWGGLIMLMT